MNKKEIKQLQKNLAFTRKSAWSKTGEKDAVQFAVGYIDFLNKVKTEWEAVDYFKELLAKKGFSEKSNTKKMFIHKDKLLIAGDITDLGKSDLKLIIAHIDSPRIDLKQNPLYEETGIAYLKTHYYGGLKKYQWLNIPLELHGRVFMKSGEEKRITLGTSADDPYFVISDLLPHLSHKTVDEKSVKDAFPGENLRVMAGNMPFQPKDDDIKDAVKLNILKLLNEKYGITEEDFLTSEFEIVPGLKSRFIGFDKSMIGGYGQDDRICAYSAVNALLDSSIKGPCIVMLVDREEIGSDGNTGAKSHVLRNTLKKWLGTRDIDDALMNSFALSADVNSAVDPNFKEVFEPDNNSMLGFGIVVTKFTGSGGKYSASEADARYLARLRSIFEKNKVVWQIGEIGKVDLGGGGTIAKYLAEYGMDIVDAGPAVMGMHSPYEVTSSADLLMTYKAFKAFFEKF